MAEYITLARPYAKAAYEVAQQKGEVENFFASLQAMSQVVQETNLVDLLQGPVLRQAQKESLLQAVLEALPERVQNLIKVLYANKRLVLVPALAEAFQQAMNQAESRVTVDVFTARKLTQAAEKKLTAALKRKLAKEVVLQTYEDADLMAGGRVRVGDWVMENSVKAQLARLAAQLNA